VGKKINLTFHGVILLILFHHMETILVVL